MCVGDTKYIMLEMPSDIWNDWVFNAIYVIRARRGLIPVIAHIDRYNEAPLSRLLDMGLITQVNAEALLPLRSRTKMLRLFSSGLSHVLGSDVHRNTDAYDKFSRALKILGRDRSRRLMKNAQTILSGGEIAR
jgi:tyrosine-protein phosphatase YwqE